MEDSALVSWTSESRPGERKDGETEGFLLLYQCNPDKPPC